MKNLTVPEGAFTEEKLEQCHLAKPNLSGHKFYLVRYKTRHSWECTEYGVIEPCHGMSLQFTAGDVFYYFDNYFHAFACSLKLREAKHE